MAIVVHHLNTSRSERIPWILEELGVPYEVKVHYRTKTNQAPASLKAVSPLGRAPCITIDGRLLTESGPIVHTLITTCPRGPDSTVEDTPSPQSQFWSHYSEASFMNVLAAGRVLEIAAAQISATATEEETKGIKKLIKWHNGYTREHIGTSLAEIERFLAENRNFSGSDKIGEGDIMLGWSLFLLAPTNGHRPFKLGPATEEWIARTRARPAYIRAMERIKREEREQAGNAKGKL